MEGVKCCDEYAHHHGGVTCGAGAVARVHPAASSVGCRPSPAPPMISKPHPLQLSHLHPCDTMTSAPTICSSCLRSMQAAARTRPLPVRQTVRVARRGFAVASNSATSPTTPLLDFLAPSIRSCNLQSLRRPARLQSVEKSISPRTFSSSASRRAAVLNPRKDEDGNEMVVGITPRAAHVRKPQVSRQ